MDEDDVIPLPPGDIYFDGERMMLVLRPGRYRLGDGPGVLVVEDPDAAID